jgi:hypothetical protein
MTDENRAIPASANLILGCKNRKFIHSIVAMMQQYYSIVFRMCIYNEFLILDAGHLFQVYQKIASSTCIAVPAFPIRHGLRRSCCGAL